MNKIVMLLLAAWLAMSGAFAQPVRVDAVEAELVAARDAAVPGATLMLGLRIRHAPQWHTYWRNPGDSGLATRLDLTLPPGWQAGEIIWPAPRRIFIGPLANYGFENELLLPVPVSVPADAHGTVRLQARAQWLVCRELCIPGQADLELSLPVASAAGPSASAALFERAAIATPREPLPVRVAAATAGGGAWLGFDRSQAGSAEFFPYHEGLLSAPAPQRLYRLDGDAGWRLELITLDGVDGSTLERSGFRAGPIGVMVLDGQPFEVVARPGEVASGGRLVAVAQESAGGGGGFLAGIGGAAGLLDKLSGAAIGKGAAPVIGSGPGLWLALVFGALGGLILNLMPCVFPVVGLKILGFAGQASAGALAAGGTGAGAGAGVRATKAARQAARASGRRSAWAFAAGVLLSFWLLAALLLALRGAGQAVGWGFQLQSPPFVAAIALLFMVIGLNFAGVFEFGTGLTRLGGVDASVAGRGGLTGAFGSGVLAVLVATPCTAPFMGSALGYTLGRPAIEVLLVFAAIALGMALPYVVLGSFPGWLRWLPRPGRWMESLRQLLAFPMFATVAWLAWVLGLQAGIDAVLALAIGAVLVALAAWLYGRFVQSSAVRGRGLAALLSLSALVSGLWLAWPGSAPILPNGASARSAAGIGVDSPALADGGWQPWSEARVAQARAAGQAVFVDFTAAWCVSCQANKKLVLDRQPVVDAMNRQGVLRLRADWTVQDPAITAELASHGRNGVPLYLLYLPGQTQPRILPEILTSRLVLDALAARS